MNISCPKCGSNDVQNAAMIVATGTTTGKSRSFGSGIGSTLDGGFGGGWYSGSSTNTSKTDLAQRYSFESGVPALGCIHWLFTIIFIIVLSIGLSSEDYEVRGWCGLTSFFSGVIALSVWGFKRKRLKEARAHKETIDRLWVCLRCGCEFFPHSSSTFRS